MIKKLCVLLMFCCVSMPAKAGVTEARAWADNIANQLLNSFSIEDKYDRYDALDQIIQDNLDTDFISQFVAGKYWRTMKPNEKTEYQKVFRDYILATYKTLPLKFEGAVQYSITSCVAGAKTGEYVLDSQVQVPSLDKPMQLELYIRERANSFALYDIKISGVSQLIVYRDMITKMIVDADDEISWFIEDLQKETDKKARGL